MAEQPTRPGGEVLDEILVRALGGGQPGTSGDGAEAKEPGFFQQLGTTIGSLQRFMRSLSQ